MPTTILTSRLEESSLCRPSEFIYSHADRMNVASSEMFGEFRKAPGNTADGKNVAVSFVPVLILSRIPLAVARLVVAVIFNTFYSKPRRTLSHIVKKVLKGATPSVANRNAAPAVIVEVRIFGIKAASDDTAPCVVRPRRFAALMMAVNTFCFGNHLTRKASTGFASAISQAAVVNGKKRPAFTNTQTVSCKRSAWVRLARGISQNFELSKGATDEVYWGTHGIGVFNVVFSGGRPATTGAHCDYQRFYAGVN